jgi:hypothetical protein
MILLTAEKLIPLREAPSHLPRRSNGKTLHISAIYRWMRSGVRGVRLETLKLGGTTYTSLEALQRFAIRLGAKPSTESGCAPTSKPRSRHEVSTARLLEAELGLTPNSLRVAGTS